MKKNMEMKIYELLGVRFFKKVVMGLVWLSITPIIIGKSKKEKMKIYYNLSTNYTLGKIDSLEDIKKFKKNLLLHASIHTLVLLAMLSNLFIIIGSAASLATLIAATALIGMNIYCIMLQRYNNIRINQVIKKRTPYYEKQKNKMKEELRKNDALLLEHTYKMIDKKGKETSITFEDLIANATFNQLKKYREYLTHFHSMNQEIQENNIDSDKSQIDRRVPIEKHKSLKIEMKNINNKS